MKLAEIQEEWAEDSVINPTDLEGELHKIPKLHSKYFNILNAEKQSHKNKEIEYNRLKKIKRSYYLGRFSKKLLAELGWEPIDHEIGLTEVADYLRGDADLAKIEKSMSQQEIKIKFLEEIIKSINSRGFNINTAVKWQAFKNGQN